MKNFIFGILLAIVIAVLDQFSKYFVFSWLDNFSSQMYKVTSFFSLVKVYNKGVSFGMLSGIPYGRVGISVLVSGIIIFFIYLLFRSKTKIEALALGSIIGGALGNLTDRVFFGAVSDFLDFYIKNYHWPAFNLADTAVFIGVSVLLLEKQLIKLFCKKP